MNTEQFMILTGIKHRTSITRYIKNGIIKPIKVRGRNDFSHEDVGKIQQFFNAEVAREFEKSESEKLQEFIKQTEDRFQALGEAYRLLLDRVVKLENSN